MPEWWFRQEYGCEFTETEDSVFSYDSVQNALADIAPLFGPGDTVEVPSTGATILGLSERRQASLGRLGKDAAEGLVSQGGTILPRRGLLRCLPASNLNRNLNDTLNVSPFP